MAESEPTMSGGQVGAPDHRRDSVEMEAIDSKAGEGAAPGPEKDGAEPSSLPAVPAKDTPPAAGAAETTSSPDQSAPPAAAAAPAPAPAPAATTTDPAADPSATTEGAAASEAPEPASEERQDSLSIGPSDAPHGQQTAADGGAVCTITLLLPTGARHPYRIDERYLAKRNVEVPDRTEDGRGDPFSISIYKLKELILREWRDEWEGKPASPSSIRLIHFGKLLDDKEQLKKYQFSAEAPNVVHMSVRPAEMMEEDEAAKGKTNAREGRSSDGGSGCCVIL